MTALVASPLSAPIQEPCAFVREENWLEAVVAVAVAAPTVAVAVAVEDPEVAGRLVAAESGEEDRRGSE